MHSVSIMADLKLSREFQCIKHYCGTCFQAEYNSACKKIKLAFKMVFTETENCGISYDSMAPLNRAVCVIDRVTQCTNLNYLNLTTNALCTLASDCVSSGSTFKAVGAPPLH